MKLQPRIIFSSGIMATGKTTIMKSLAKKIDNSLYLDRDDINQGNSYVSPTQTSDLPNFEQYIANAKIFPDHIRMVETAFGEMWKVDPHNESDKQLVLKYWSADANDVLEGEKCLDSRCYK